MFPADGYDPENRTGKYVLNEEGEPVEEPDLIKWAMWYETAERIVLQTRIGEARVSTIFLGLDFNHFRLLAPPGERPLPLLWETMVFGQGSAFQGWGRRYTSKLTALAGHLQMCELVERFDAPAAPRRLKKALRKYAASHPLRPGERARVRRWAAQVSAVTAGRFPC